MLVEVHIISKSWKIHYYGYYHRYYKQSYYHYHVAWLPATTFTSATVFMLVSLTHPHVHAFTTWKMWMDWHTDMTIRVYIRSKYVLQWIQNEETTADFQQSNVTSLNSSVFCVILLPINYPFYTKLHNNLTFKLNNIRENSHHTHNSQHHNKVTNSTTNAYTQWTYNFACSSR
jgi:hypothetical protein